MKYLSYLIMVLCACSLHAQRNISNTDGIVYSTPISVLDVMDMGTTGTITNAAGIGVKPDASITFNGTGSSSRMYANNFGDNVYIDRTLNVFSSWNTIGSRGYVTRVPNAGFVNGAASALSWSDSNDGATGTLDLRLYRDAAETLAQRNGANAQTSRIYGTYTDSSNYERLSLSHDGSGVGTIGVESGGSGSANQSLKLQVAGNGALYVENPTYTAGNARGVNAVDLQTGRTAANQVASGDYSTAIGFSSRAEGSYSTAINCIDGLASASYALVVGGRQSYAQGSYSVSIGSYNSQATGQYSFVSGNSSYANLTGQRAYASGRFAASGDAQGSRLVARNTTSGTTPADLFLNGTSERLVLPSSKSWGFTVSVVGRTVDNGSGAEQSAFYKFEGLIKRDGANNTTLVGTVTKTVLAEDDSTWDVDVTASDSTESLDITCTGGTGDNTRWVATIQLTEVGG